MQAELGKEYSGIPHWRTVEKDGMPDHENSVAVQTVYGVGHIAYDWRTEPGHGDYWITEGSQPITHPLDRWIPVSELKTLQGGDDA